MLQPRFASHLTRCTNQNNPHAVTAAETQRVTGAAYAERWIHRSTGQTSATAASWPISTPRLNMKRLVASASRGSAISRSTFANPKPCTSPKTNVSLHRPRGASETRFSTPTYAMLRAITASTMRAGGLTRPNVAAPSVRLCAIVNDETMATSWPTPRPATSNPSRNSK
jgi:hypothetical protein